MKKLCAIGLVFIIFYINFTSISASHNNSGRFVSIYPAVNEEIDAQKYKERLLAQVESEKILLHLKIRKMFGETGDLPEMLRITLQAGIPVQCRYGKLRRRVGDKSEYQSFYVSRAG